MTSVDVSGIGVTVKRPWELDLEGPAAEWEEIPGGARVVD